MEGNRMEMNQKTDSKGQLHHRQTSEFQWGGYSYASSVLICSENIWPLVRSYQFIHSELWLSGNTSAWTMDWQYYSQAVTTQTPTVFGGDAKVCLSCPRNSYDQNLTETDKLQVLVANVVIIWRCTYSLLGWISVLWKVKRDWMLCF